VIITNYLHYMLTFTYASFGIQTKARP